MKYKIVSSDEVPNGEIWFVDSKLEKDWRPIMGVWKQLIQGGEVNMKRVLIESPFAAKPSVLFGEQIAERERNERYLEACIFDSLGRGEAPFASHGFYTRWLKDTKPEERKLGMACGKAWARKAEVVAFYVDYGMTPGMLQMLDWVLQELKGRITSVPAPELRRIPGWFEENLC